MCQPTVVVGAWRNHATFSRNEKLSEPLPSATFSHCGRIFYPLEMQKTPKNKWCSFRCIPPRGGESGCTMALSLHFCLLKIHFMEDRSMKAPRMWQTLLAVSLA